MQSFTLNLIDTSNNFVFAENWYSPDGWTVDTNRPLPNFTANNENTMLEYGGELKDLSVVVTIPQHARGDPNGYLNDLFKKFSEVNLSN